MAVSVPEQAGRRAKRPRLAQSLREAEEYALAELAAVRELLERAVDAAIRCDAASAEEVTASAHEFNRRYGDVHERLMAVIARQAPVASDLRLAIALLHVNDRVDRMAAQCLNIATLCSAGRPESRPSAEQLECFGVMARLADEQIAEAGRSFAERDVEGAMRLREHDLAINEHNRQCFALAVDDAADDDRREIAFFVALMARAIERIGDNAVDVGQQAAFAVTGRLRPHAAS
jgi:phosphate transport system protein